MCHVRFSSVYDAVGCRRIALYWLGIPLSLALLILNEGTGMESSQCLEG